MAFMGLGQLGTTTSVADLWGWTDPLNGREYALVGTRTGTSFVDITDPTAPVLVGILPAHDNVSNLWRDVDVSGNWCFVGSEAAGHGLQVFDLTRLRNVTTPPATFTEDAHYAGFGNSHTIFADKGAPYVYAVGTGTYSGGLHVVNVSNPLVPTFAGAWSSDGYIHENNVILYNGPDKAHVGKRISLNFHINANDRVSFIDVSDPSDMSLIGNTAPYPGARLCHQGWVTPDHRYLLMNDEGDEGSPNNYNTRTHIFDIQDLEAPVYHGFFSGPNASYDHNLYIHQDLVWEANYSSGLHILDAELIPSGTLSLEAWFDTYTTDNAKHYDGAWGNYPFFESGVVIVSDYDNGLFILRPRTSLRLKAFLEGPYDQSSGLMVDQLRVQGLIPLEEPYTAAGYVFEGEGGGESTNASVLAVTGPDAIVDWVVVELRDADDPSTVMASRAALIQRDGDIVGVDGVSPVRFGVAVKDYHIGIRHRNHFGVVSAQALRVSVVEKSYDLSDGSTALHGTEPTKSLGPIEVLWAGNALPDGMLKYAGLNNDRDVVLQAIGGIVPTNTVSGYRMEDLNLDGEVKYTGSLNDRDIILQNIGGVVPTNIRVEQVP